MLRNLFKSTMLQVWESISLPCLKPKKMAQDYSPSYIDDDGSMILLKADDFVI